MTNRIKHIHESKKYYRIEGNHQNLIYSDENLDGLPLNIDTKILIYEDRVNGWFLDFARNLLNDDHAGYVVLQICLSYIEGNQEYREGKSSQKKKSTEFFNNGLQRIFKSDFQIPNADSFYSQVRCGLFHDGMTKNRVIISKDPNCFTKPVEIDNGVFKLNPELFFQFIEDDLKLYVKQLKDKKNVDLRNNFEIYWDERKGL